MVSAALADALSDPLSLLLSLQHSQHNISSLPTRAAALFRSIFKSDDALAQIPPLYSHDPHPSHSLVRFRAMVQDTSLAPELYPALLPSGGPGAWGLAETHPDPSLDVGVNNLTQRHLLWAVSVPGESPFIAKILDDQGTVPLQSTPPTPHSITDPVPHLPIGLSTSYPHVTSLKTDSVHPASPTLPHALLRHKDPLARPHHLGLLIKIYDAPHADAPLKPTELHTFVGFFSLEHASLVQDDNSPQLPLPTLHVLFSVPHPLTIIPFPPHNPQNSSILDTRAALIRWIADEALAGDTDAAEWVLLASIARVHSRAPQLLPLTLTLAHFPAPPSPAAPPALQGLLACLLPLLVPLPLTLPLLNDPARPFAPASRGEHLHAGLLQLPAGCAVLVTESGMAEGSVGEQGMKKLHALGTAVASQTLAYDFPFAPPYFLPTDLAFIVLSQGRTSAFVKTDVTVPLASGESGERCYKPAAEIALPAPATLAAFRALIGGAKTGTVRVPEDISQFIQDEFVSERQQGEKERVRVTAADLMNRMRVARLMALSRHDAELSREVWTAARALDTRRNATA